MSNSRRKKLLPRNTGAIFLNWHSKRHVVGLYRWHSDVLFLWRQHDGAAQQKAYRSIEPLLWKQYTVASSLIGVKWQVCCRSYYFTSSIKFRPVFVNIGCKLALNKPPHPKNTSTPPFQKYSLTFVISFLFHKTVRSESIKRCTSTVRQLIFSHTQGSWVNWVTLR